MRDAIFQYLLFHLQPVYIRLLVFKLSFLDQPPHPAERHIRSASTPFPLLFIYFFLATPLVILIVLSFIFSFPLFIFFSASLF